MCRSEWGVGLGYSFGYGCTVESVVREFPCLQVQGPGLASAPGLAPGQGQAPGLGLVQRDVLWGRYLEHCTKEVVRINATAR